MESGSGKRSVLVVEDDALLRRLISASLAQAGFDVRDEPDAIQAAVTCNRFDPDAVVVDANLGAGPDGFEFVEISQSLEHGRGVVFLSNYPDSRFSRHSSRQVMERAAYLSKNNLTDLREVVDAVEAALHNRSQRMPDSFRHDLEARQELASRYDAATLTRAQLDVLRLIAEGYTNHQIAVMRNTTLRAVELLARRLFAVLGIDPNASNPRVAATRRYFEIVQLMQSRKSEQSEQPESAQRVG